MRKVKMSSTGWKRNFLCLENGANFPSRLEKNFLSNEKDANFTDRMEKKLSLSRERCPFPQQDGKETFFAVR